MNRLSVYVRLHYPPSKGERILGDSLPKALAQGQRVYRISLMQEDLKRKHADELEDVRKVWFPHESRWFSPGTLKSFLGFLSSRPRSCVDTLDPSVKHAVREVSPFMGLYCSRVSAKMRLAAGSRP